MWSLKRKRPSDEFPKGFSVQHIGVKAAKEISALPPREIAEFFRQFPSIATALLDECADKRFTPSTFIGQDGERFIVGWFSRKCERQCVRDFSNLADAATDYLLFSMGKGRWAP